ncbi:hypothetical protein H7F51_04400 [Novosphingobium flavum]|uniref:Uncharacterized protein n=1 Tax=Novosphingobium flavum TaxID=1778672 RepID=A0A7X1KL07_9SPHN|nr:hypothetical protein [Novosphingobium flavum]MBC2664755.1 hypothetical protein [Novosphingobium flavum]
MFRIELGAELLDRGIDVGGGHGSADCVKLGLTVAHALKDFAKFLPRGLGGTRLPAIRVLERQELRHFDPLIF